MAKIFISYRRKESVDFTGRLFDRLYGYFGPNRVYMDVDELVAGKDYRSQIGKIIDSCDVVLVVIGRQWLEIRDEFGKRRLDNPDDQLRIEVESALQRSKKILPILIHGAERPGADQLPESISAIATLEMLPMESGLPFNADMKKLIDRLEKHLQIHNPDRRFPWELLLIPCGTLLVLIGLVGVTGMPSTVTYLQSRMPAGLMPQLAKQTLADYQLQLWDLFWYGVLPLTLGPPMIVAGKRWCCLMQENTARRAHFSSGIGRRRAPKSRFAVYSLASGLAAIGAGVLATIPAIVFAFLAFWETKRHKGWIRGRSLAVFGLITGLLGISTTLLVQLPYWTFHQWLENVEKAETAVLVDDTTIALEHYTAAANLYAAPSQEWGVALYNRAVTLASVDRNDAAIADLTQIIDRWILPADDMYQDLFVIKDAYELRQTLYRKIGDEEKANQDRDALSKLFESGWVLPQESLFTPEINEMDAPPPPAPMPAPMPTPIIDPDA